MHRQYHYKIPERTLQSFHRKEPDSVWNPVHKYKDEYSDYRCTRPEAFPPIKYLVPFAVFSTWVDEALELMREQIKNNPNIKNFVNE